MSRRSYRPNTRPPRFAKTQHNLPGHGATPGLPVDAFGSSSIDPTENVKDLMDASVKSLTREADLQAMLADEKIRRLEREMINQEKLAIREREHSAEIRRMESDRVNSIRSVDVANAAATAAQLLSAVTTLATTAQATAETLRNQVAATAAAVASQTERVVNPIIERLAILEKSSYRGEGRSAISDPAFQDLVIEMRKTREGVFEQAGRAAVVDPQVTKMLGDMQGVLTRLATGTGKAEGLSQGAMLFMGGIGLVATLVTIASGLAALAAVAYAALK